MLIVRTFAIAAGLCTVLSEYFVVSPRVAHVFHHRAKPSGLSVFAG